MSLNVEEQPLEVESPPLRSVPRGTVLDLRKKA